MRGAKLRGWPALAAVAVAMGSSLGGFTPAHAAVPVSKVGWWTRSPSPPTVPEGGLSVGVAPDGNLSVAAIGLDTAGGAAQAKVTLKETSDSQGGPTASLQVCTTTDEWSAGAGGDLTTAPRPTCPQDPVLLKRADDGTWTADVASLIASQHGEVSVMIVPAPSAAPVPGVQAAAYQLSFDKPTVDGSVLPETSSSSSSSSDSFATDTSSQSSPSFAPPAATSLDSSPAFAPVGNSPSAVLPPTQAPAAVTSPNAGGGQVSFPVNAVGADTKNPSRVVIIGFVLLSLLVGGAAAAVRAGQERGVFERLLPSGGSGMLQPPAE